MKPLVVRGPQDHRRLVELMDQRRQQKGYAWRDVYDRTPDGKHNGFNRVVADTKGDYKVQTLLALLVALGLEFEIRVRPAGERKVRRAATAAASPTSADPPVEGSGG